MKKTMLLLLIFLLWVLGACATGDKPRASKTGSAVGGMGIEQAITQSSDFFVSQLPQGRVVAILGIETPTKICSEFILTEIWKHFQSSGKFIMADQQNVERIQRQLVFQASGYVSDDSAQRVGQAIGAQTIVYGRLVKMGSLYRLTLFSTEVEAHKSILDTKDLNPNDRRLNELLEPGDLDSRIESAITEMASNLDQQLLIGIGRIGYRNATGSITDLSKYLENQIRFSASRLYTRYAVADETASNNYQRASANTSWVDSNPGRIMAMVQGNYIPNGQNALVTLNLVSTDSGSRVLGSGRFVMTSTELNERNLSMLPPNYNDVEAYEKYLDILAECDTENNEFEFNVQAIRSTASYVDGEYLSFSLYSEEECYFVVRSLQVNAELKIMYPTEPGEDNKIEAGQTRILPDRGRIRLREPYGEEYILVYAYRNQVKEELDYKPVSIANAHTVTGRGAEKTLASVIFVDDQDIPPVACAKFSYTVTGRRGD